MDALLVGSSLAAGGYLLNTSNPKNTQQSKEANFENAYTNNVIDSRLIDRNTLERHMQKENIISHGMYVERPKSGRSTMSLTGEGKRKQ